MNQVGHGAIGRIDRERFHRIAEQTVLAYTVGTIAGGVARFVTGSSDLGDVVDLGVSIGALAATAFSEMGSNLVRRGVGKKWACVMEILVSEIAAMGTARLCGAAIKVTGTAQVVLTASAALVPLVAMAGKMAINGFRSEVRALGPEPVN